MQVRVEERAPREFVIALDGELDLATEPLLTDAVRTLMAGPVVGALVVDLAGLRFLDSSGMRALLRAHRLAEEQGATFMVVRPQPNVAELLRIAAMHHVLGIDNQQAKPPASPGGPAGPAVPGGPAGPAGLTGPGGGSE